MQFTVPEGSNFVFTDAVVPLQLLAGANEVLVSLLSDAGGIPGSVIESIDVQGAIPTNAAGLVTATSALNPTLTAGTSYWLVLSTPAANTLVFWSYSLADVTGFPYGSVFNFMGSLRGPWIPQDVGVFRTAFQIDGNGSSVPPGQFAWHGPFTFFTGVTGNPSFVQATPGTYGTKGNFELVVPLLTGGLAHFFRDNDNPSLPWNGPFNFATDQGLVSGVSLIQSNFSNQFASTGVQGQGNLAVVANIGSTLDYFFREDVTFTWSGPTTIATGVTGVPSFVQARPGTYGAMGNYELVTPLASGGLAHFYRDNDNPSLPWVGPFVFGTDQGIVSAVSLIQSNFSTQFDQTGVQGPGNLAVVALIGSDLVYFYRDDVAPFTWHGPTMLIATGATGNPSFVQATPGTYGAKGNYELAVPLLSGGIAHFYRNNDDPSLPWTQTAIFGTTLGEVQGVSLIQSNFSTQLVNTGVQGPGNLAVVSVADNQLSYFYRDDE
jgi:hypothetical protein